MLKYKTALISSSILLLTLSFQIIPFYNVFLTSVYRRQSGRPSFYEGGLELIALFLFLCWSERFIKRKSLILLALLSGIFLYLRLHHVDLPVLASLIYLEVIISFGFFLQSFLNIEPNHQGEGYISAFIIGCTAWLSLATLISVFGFGTIGNLRILTIALAVICFYRSQNTLASVKVYKFYVTGSLFEKYNFLFLAIIILSLYAKTNVAFDSDSIWYGLRPEHVLFGNSSFFQNLGFTAVVFYYPKLAELFFAPLSGLGDFSFILGVNIFLFMMVLLTAYQFINKICHNSKYSLLGVSLIACTPALANISTTAKSDVFSIFFILSSAYFLYQYYNESKYQYLSLGIAAGILATGGKLTSLPYTALLFIGIIFVIILRYFFQKRHTLHPTPPKSIQIHEIIFVILSMIPVIATYVRTYNITGFPIRAFKLAFMENYWKYPFTPLMLDSPIKMDLKSRLTLLYEFLLNPIGLKHVIMLWTGNLTFFLFFSLCCLVLFNYINTKKIPVVLLGFFPMIVSGIYFAAFGMALRGGDGNYYLPPLILAFIVFYGVIFSYHHKLKLFLHYCLLLFIPLQVTMMFISHPSWHPGTDSFKFDLFQSVFDSIEWKETELKKEGLVEIEEYLVSNQSAQTGSRAISMGTPSKLELLSCRLESFETASISLWDPKTIGSSLIGKSPVELLRYIDWANIHYLIMPIWYDWNDTFKKTYDLLALNPDVKQIFSLSYKMLDLKEIHLKKFSFQTESETIKQYPDYRKIYHLEKMIDQAIHNGKKSERIPWKNSIAPVKLKIYGRPSSIVVIGNSKIEYTIDIPKGSSPVFFKSFVGFYPSAAFRKVSDGVNMKISVQSDGKEWVLANLDLLPPSPIQEVKLPLDRFAGKKIQLIVETYNLPGGSDAGDWIVLIEPAVFTL